MALVRNARSIFTNPGTYGGILTLNTGNAVKGGLRNRETYFSGAFTAYPNGTRVSQSFIQPRNAGSISSYNRARLTLAPVASLTPGAPMNVSGSMLLSVLAADLDQIVALVASGSAAISVLTANLSAGVQMAAVGTASMSVLSAQLGGIIPVEAASSMSLSPDVTMTANAFMIAEAGGPTALSPEGLAQAVWSALLADYQIVGTMGKAMSDAGSAGDPWSTLLPGSYAPGTAGDKLSKIDDLPTLTDIESSTEIAKEDTLDEIKKNTDLIPGLL